MKKIFTLISLLALTACGFNPGDAELFYSDGSVIERDLRPNSKGQKLPSDSCKIGDTSPLCRENSL